MNQKLKQALIDGLIGTRDIETLAEVFEGYVIFNPDTYTIIDAKTKYNDALAVMRRHPAVDLAAIECGQTRLVTWTL
ncbi:MAG: hypothetical protein H8D67_02665 [Deltaproteobacteria bacterium]|nr:hypothetical protein [Deltaproteobacteria bacterium]